MIKRKTKKSKTAEPIRVRSHFEKLSSYFLNMNLRDFAMFYFGCFTGRRISDIVALNIGDVAEIDTKGRFRVKRRFEIREKKTGKFINMPLSLRACNTLGKFLRQRKKESIERGESVAEILREPLFNSQKPRRSGEFRLTEKSAWRIIKTGAKACGIEENIGTHTLRKTFGYMLYQHGYSIETIQKLLNHSSPEITLAYIGIKQDDLDDAVLSIDISDLRPF